MTATSPTERRHVAMPDRPALDRAIRSLALLAFSRIDDAQLEVVEDGGRRHRFGDPSSDLRAVVRVHRSAFFRALLGGSTGLADAYVDGAWDCDDLVALVRVVSRNLDALDRLQERASPLLGPLQSAAEWMRRNTRTRSRNNIAEHYDLGNDLFSRMLDDTMMYSCGVWQGGAQSLHDASVSKIDRLCRKLELHGGDHLVEIGTGWGGLAVHAAATYGCRVTTTTISTEQHDLAKERVQRAGLSDRVTVLLDDYRDLRGRYTKLVSVEMVEAIGWRYYDTFMAVCARLLDSTGLAAIQAICQPHRTLRSVRGKSTFINTRIFPGGICPSVESLLLSADRTRDLRLVNLEDITAGYPPTLRAWRENFLARWHELEGRWDERFKRAWTLYLSLCEASFAERRITDVQLLLAKRGVRAERLPSWSAATAAATADPLASAVLA
ncbi:MAG: class I SAM-dependent methyltransferase [Candidatus Dormibacteria bacterium]